MVSTTDNTTRFFYQAFGLNIRSEIEFQGVPRLAPGPFEVDVFHVQRKAPDTQSGCRGASQDFLFWDPNGGLVRAVKGEKLEFAYPEGGLTESTILFVQASGMGALLQQRGYLTLHAAAIRSSRGKAVLLAGRCGIGKSSLSTLLSRRGYKVLTDDLSAVYKKGDEWWVQPGFPRIKLRPDVAQAVGATGLTRIHPQVDKYFYHESEGFLEEPLPVELMVRLDGPPGPPRELNLPEKARALTEVTYRREFLWDIDPQNMAKHFQTCAQIAERWPMHLFGRDAAGPTLEETAHAVERLL